MDQTIARIAEQLGFQAARIWPQVVMVTWVTAMFWTVVDPLIVLGAAFWAKVNKTDGCWLWTAGISEGYGKMKWPGYSSPAPSHRISWELRYGPIPDGLLVCHSCDVNYARDDITYRRCVRPEHLFLGTNADNMADCAAKGRTHRGDNKGEANGNARLTEARVRELRDAYIIGEDVRQLSREFGVTTVMVRRIGRGLAWTHVL